MTLYDIVALTLIIILAITFIIVMLALAWALFEDTEIGQMITERFKERREDDA